MATMSLSNHSVSVVIPAFNEEETVASAIAATDEALKRFTSDYEIIVVDDGSRDRTGAVIDEAARMNNRLRPLHNSTNMNLGYNLRRAIREARKEYTFAFVSADNYPSPEHFHNLLSAIGKNDIVIGYLIGFGNRVWPRRLLSWMYSKIMNVLFWQRIRYYNGPLIVPTEMWRSVPMTVDGFAYMSEVTATLLKRGVSYTEIPFALTAERKGLNVAMLRRNTGSVVRAVLSMFWRLNIKRQYYV